MKENKINQVEMEAIEVEEIVEETKPEGFKAKAMNMLEKHGKKLAIGAAITVIGGVIIAVAKSLAGQEDADESDIFDADFEVIEFGSEATE